MSREPFSHRVPASLEAGPWARRLAALRAQGRPLIDLSDQNPTTADLGYLDDPALHAALSDPGPASYTPVATGLAAARAAIAEYYFDRGLVVAPSQVVLTSSTSEAYAHAFRLLCEPGETVLVPRPSYPLFEALAHAEGCRIATYPLVVRGGAWRIDLHALESQLKATPGARAIVTVNPNHPTGSYLSLTEATTLSAMCDVHNLSLITDEVFGDSLAQGARDPSTLVPSLLPNEGGFPGTSALLLTLSGLSKVCGLPQVKLGWMVVAGDPARRDAALARLEWLADAFLSVGQAVQHALPALLAGRMPFQKAVRARVARNRAELDRVLAALPHTSLLPADGGWSAIIALPPVRTDEEWALALLEHDVIVHPGYFYDFDEPGRLVLSLLPPPGEFDRALAALFQIALG